MKKSIKELKEERGALAMEMRSLLDTSENRENPGFTTEERAKYDEMKKRYDALDERINLLEEDEARAASGAHRVPGSGDGKTPSGEQARQEEMRSAFIDFVRGRITKEDIREELRASMFTGASENQIIIPKLVTDQVVHALKAGGTFLGEIDLLITTNAIPYVKSTIDTTDKPLKRLVAGTENTEDKVQFKGVQISAYDYTTPIYPIHIELLEGTNIDVEAVLVEAITNTVRRGLEDLATQSGTGSDDINALLNAATKGATAASADEITYNDLVNLFASVDAAYGNSRNGSFMMNSNTLAAVMRIVDGNGRPIFLTDLQTGEISRILGRKLVINEAMPDIGSGAKAVVFGDLKYYHMRMVGGIRLAIFKELYAKSLEVGFMGHVRADGDLIDAGTHPVKYLEMGA